MLTDPHREPSSPEEEAVLYENARLRAERNSLRDMLGGALKDRHQISVLGQRITAQARRLRRLYDLLDRTLLRVRALEVIRDSIFDRFDGKVGVAGREALHD